MRAVRCGAERCSAYTLRSVDAASCELFVACAVCVVIVISLVSCVDNISSAVAQFCSLSLSLSLCVCDLPIFVVLSYRATLYAVLRLFSGL